MSLPANATEAFHHFGRVAGEVALQNLKHAARITSSTIRMRQRFLGRIFATPRISTVCSLAGTKKRKNTIPSHGSTRALRQRRKEMALPVIRKRVVGTAKTAAE